MRTKYDDEIDKRMQRLTVLYYLNLVLLVEWLGIAVCAWYFDTCETEAIVALWVTSGTSYVGLTISKLEWKYVKKLMHLGYKEILETKFT